MKIIKNQKYFKINSLLEFDGNANDLLDVFWETLYDVVNKSDIDRVQTSYSYLSSARDRNINENPDRNFKNILADFKAYGWDSDALTRLFNKHGDEIADDYNNGRHNVWQTGMIDYFIYKMTDGKALLMGYNTKNVHGSVKGDEAFFKFSYGYNKTPYGKLAMEQHFGSLDNYYDYLGEHFAEFLKDGVRDEIITGQEDFMKAIEEMGIKDLQQHYTYDKVNNVGTLDLKAAGVDLNSSPDILDPLIDFLNSAGLFVDTNSSRSVKTGGSANIEDGVVKLYFK